jgi:hypothetical protein
VPAVGARRRKQSRLGGGRPGRRRSRASQRRRQQRQASPQFIKFALSIQVPANVTACLRSLTSDPTIFTASHFQLHLRRRFGARGTVCYGRGVHARQGGYFRARRCDTTPTGNKTTSQSQSNTEQTNPRVTATGRPPPPLSLPRKQHLTGGDVRPREVPPDPQAGGGRRPVLA